MPRDLTNKEYKSNFYSFIWHGIFLSLAINFTDVHTIIPSMLIKAGANSILLGILTAIMMGGSQLMQIVFAGYLSNKSRKKGSLLLGINLRVVSLLILSILMLRSLLIDNDLMIILIFVFITIFSISGSFAGISYVDLTGKTISKKNRKHFFSLKQVFSSIGIIISAIFTKQILTTYSHPNNYGILFMLAGILLLVATLGFWKIKEISVQINDKHNFKRYLQKIPHEIRQNSNLKNYLFIINNLGLGLSIIPFMVLFAKKNFTLSYGFIGNILIYKVAGMLITSLILYKRSKSFEYKKLLYFSLVLGLLLPILSLIFSNNLIIYQLIFSLSGVFITTYRIAKSGVLLEISDNENRAVYAGITGAGSILPTIFPLVAGVSISLLGYNATFIIVSLIIASSFLFITKMDCHKTTKNLDQNKRSS